jgi:hypothetical protein
MVLFGLSLTGCIEEERKQVKKEVCTELERQTEEALAVRDRANAGLTGGAQTPRVPLCLEE